MAGFGRPRVADYRRIVQLRARGWTLARIGEFFGISRQAIYQALKTAANRGAAICCPCQEKFSVPKGAYNVRDIYCLPCLARLPDAPVGRRIASLRIKLGLSRAELARRMKISVNTIVYVEDPEYRPKKRPEERLLEFLQQAFREKT